MVEKKKRKRKKILYQLVVFDNGDWTALDKDGNELKEVTLQDVLDRYEQKRLGKKVKEEKVFVEYTVNPRLVCRGNRCRWVG